MTSASTVGRTRSVITLVAACLAVLILPASLTGTSVAVPWINSEFRPGLVELQWVVNAYNLTFAAFMLVSGSLADVLGRRRVFVFGTALFAVCAFVAALADNIILLDVVRALSGVGAAAMMTGGSALLAQVYVGARLARAFAIFGSAAGVGLALGPSLSGFLIGVMGWRSVFGFYCVVSVVILSLAIGVPEGRGASVASRVD